MHTVAKSWFEAGIIHVLHVGRTTRADFEAMRRESALLQAEHGSLKVLVDTSQADVHMTLMELFDFTSTHIAHYKPNTRMAVILSSKAVTIKAQDLALSCNAASNTGLLLRYFSKKQDAEDWLNSRPPA